MGIQKLLLIKTNFVFMLTKMVLFIRVLWVCFYTSMVTLLDFVREHIFRLQKNFITRKKKINLELIKAQENEEESESLLRFHFPTFDEFVRNNVVHSRSDQVIDDGSDDEGNVVSSVDGEDGFSEEMEVGNGREPSRVTDNSTNNVHKISHETHFPSEDESLVSDSDSNSVVSSSKSSFRNSFIDSLSDGFFSDIDFERAFEVDTLMKYGVNECKLASEFSIKEDIELENSSNGYSSESSDDLEDEDEDEDEYEDEDILQELKNLDSELKDVTSTFETESVTNLENLESNFVDVDDILDTETQGEQNSDNQKLESSLGDVKTESETENSEKQNRLEKEWEHQDLVEQLKMEIKKVRAIGLPTIYEESESPKIADDLKPWKIEEKYELVGSMDEVHKFYKSYRERMRKLDILNYQKMYAIGFLKLKDPLKSYSKNKISNPAIAAIVSVACWPCKPKSLTDIHQPVMKKFSRELENDLEMIYVGQMCLSWEFLCWEYGKVLELWKSDAHGVRSYNDVAEKFQTFQVLLTRFMEEEAFEGPRVQHYVKNRCVLRSLLQVPVIRDDNYRDRRKERKVVSSKDVITSLQLVEIIEESIRILWQFIRTDKDTSNVVLVNCRRSSNVELQSPADASLLAKVRLTLDKKYKKLKEVTLSENCLMRNFERCYKEEDSNHVLYFFSRVDLKLVSRVLNMSRISTEQLIWCRDKLNKLKFVGRKLHIEPSVLLFPSS